MTPNHPGKALEPKADRVRAPRFERKASRRSRRDRREEASYSTFDVSASMRFSTSSICLSATPSQTTFPSAPMR